MNRTTRKATSKLRGVPFADPHDAAVSAQMRVLRKAQSFEPLNNLDHLQKLTNGQLNDKVAEVRRKAKRLKNDPGTLLHEADLLHPDGRRKSLDQFPGLAPRPEPETPPNVPRTHLEQILRLRAQGFTGKEIAAKLGVAAKTVYRALKA